jgi:glucosamine 6-phosphate synthetase-like amidotransferase/phosphosugar isomerase protein
MKHGPIALVDGDTPSVFLIPRGAVFDQPGEKRYGEVSAFAIERIATSEAAGKESATGGSENNSQARLA